MTLLQILFGLALCAVLFAAITATDLIRQNRKSRQNDLFSDDIKRLQKKIKTVSDFNDFRRVQSNIETIRQKYEKKIASATLNRTIQLLCCDLGNYYAYQQFVKKPELGTLTIDDLIN